MMSLEEIIDLGIKHRDLFGFGVIWLSVYLVGYYRGWNQSEVGQKYCFDECQEEYIRSLYDEIKWLRENIFEEPTKVQDLDNLYAQQMAGKRQNECPMSEL